MNKFCISAKVGAQTADSVCFDFVWGLGVAKLGEFNENSSVSDDSISALPL